MSLALKLEIGELLAEKYRIEKLLGEGAMGAVYLAENVDLGRKVAIKVLLPELASSKQVAERFRQEARAAAAIGHPGIVDVLDLGRTGDHAEFIVMEHLRGESLGDCLEREGPQQSERVREIGELLMEALAAAHDASVVHRDLKPDNIFLVREPRFAVKILDFGISKLTIESEGVQTATGAVIGTPLYMAPEQAKAQRDVGPAADLYSAGAVFYEMLSGRPPFSGKTYAQMLFKAVYEPPEELSALRPDVPEDLCALVMELLRKEPSSRPPSAEAVRLRLRGRGAATPAAGLASAPTEAGPGLESAEQELESAPTVPGEAQAVSPRDSVGDSAIPSGPTPAKLLLGVLALLGVIAIGALIFWRSDTTTAYRPPAAATPQLDATPRVDTGPAARASANDQGTAKPDATTERAAAKPARRDASLRRVRRPPRRRVRRDGGTKKPPAPRNDPLKVVEDNPYKTP